MPTENIRLTVENHIATITLCNPQKHNALGAAEVHEFIDHLAELEGRADVRALIITNREGKTFCAGAALDELASGRLTSNQFAALPNKVADLKFPTIAAMNGNAFGGGAEIGLSCDFRVGVPHMKIHVPPARIGLCYPISGIERFVRLLGTTTAKRLLLANEEFDGKALFTAGYLTHLCDPGLVDPTALSLAEKIGNLAPLAIATMKRICDDIDSGSFDRPRGRQLEETCNQSDDFKEGMTAIIGKRKPVFRGR